MNARGEWRLSPAYDLTFSGGPGGEQSTMVLGEGTSPGAPHLSKLGADARLPKTTVRDIIAQTLEALAGWRSLAKAYGVRADNVKRIEARMAKTA